MYIKKKKMIFSEHLDKMRAIQSKILDYIEEKNVDNFKELYSFLDDINIRANEQVIFETFHLILQISNYHHHSNNFFTKIDYILRYFKENLQNLFSNYGIFSFFKSNKRILLFLIEEGIMTIDEQIANSLQYKIENWPKLFLEFKKLKNNKPENYLKKTIINDNLLNETTLTFLYYYFYPELKTFIDYKDYKFPEENLEIFNQKRKIGENDDCICQLIREDSIKEFFKYVKKNKISLFSVIKPSIYETNSFLLTRKDTTLIEYAAFKGSIKIFKKILAQGYDIDQSIIKYALYSNNKEIIQLIFNNISIDDAPYVKDLFITHHNKLFDINPFNQFFNGQIILLSFNYEMILDDFLEGDNEDILAACCIFNYAEMVHILMEKEDIDINKKYFFEQFGNINLIKNVGAIKGNYEIFKFLIENDNFENEPEDVLFFLLCILFNRIELFELLFKYDKIDVNHIFNGYNVTKSLLSIAVRSNSINMVKFFLQQKDVDINIHIEDEMLPPIFDAIDNDNTEILKLLIEHNDINVNEISKYHSKEYTPISYAFHAKKKEALKFLVNHPKIDVNLRIKNKVHIIMKALDNKNIEFIQYFLNNPNVNVNHTYQFDKHRTEEVPLFAYAMDSVNSTEFINLFVNHPTFDINAIISFSIVNYSVLSFAFYAKKTEIVKHILYNNLIDININEKIEYIDDILSIGHTTYLLMAIELNDIDVIKLFLDYPDIDVNAGSEFHDENQKIMKRMTPLYLAVEYNMDEAVDILLQFPQIKVNIKSFDCYSDGEETPLFSAIKNKNIKIVQKLLEMEEIDVNLIKSCTYGEEITPLMTAVLRDDIKMVQLLLSHSNIDVNLKSKYKFGHYSLIEVETPLELAVIKNSYEITSILISNPNIDINMKYNYKFKEIIYETTILGIAILNSNVEITNLLLNHQNTDVNSLIKTDVIETFPITLAVQIGNIDIIKLLLANQRIDVNNYHSELHFLSEDHYLLNKMASLHIAVANNNYEIAKLLLNHPKIDVNIKAISREISPTIYVSKENIALHMAVKKFTCSFTRLLLSHPEIDINCKDENGLIPKELTNNLLHKVLLYQKT